MLTSNIRVIYMLKATTVNFMCINLDIPWPPDAKSQLLIGKDLDVGKD